MGHGVFYISVWPHRPLVSVGQTCGVFCLKIFTVTSQMTVGCSYHCAYEPSWLVWGGALFVFVGWCITSVTLKKKGMTVVPHKPEWVKSHPVIVYFKICWNNQKQWVGNEVKGPHHMVFVIILFMSPKSVTGCVQRRLQRICTPW